MYNVVFIEASQIENDFGESKEKIDKLRALVENILKLNSEAINYIIITCLDEYKKEDYKINLLKSYFEAWSRCDDRIIVGPVVTKDLIMESPNKTMIDNSPLGEKQYMIISSFDNDTIDSILHISHGLDFFLKSKLQSRKNIVLTNDYVDFSNAMEFDDHNGRNITYLLSDKPGLEGFNECFDTYYNNSKTKKRIK